MKILDAVETRKFRKEVRAKLDITEEAESYALEAGESLLVVGNPKGRHGCGDVNVDLGGSACPVVE